MLELGWCRSCGSRSASQLRSRMPVYAYRVLSSSAIRGVLLGAPALHLLPSCHRPCGSATAVARSVAGAAALAAWAPALRVECVCAGLAPVLVRRAVPRCVWRPAVGLVCLRARLSDWGPVGGCVPIGVPPCRPVPVRLCVRCVPLVSGPLLCFLTVGWTKTGALGLQNTAVTSTGDLIHSDTGTGTGAPVPVPVPVPAPVLQYNCRSGGR